MTKMLNINDDQVVKFTNNLEKLHRSDLPIAVRSTLNDMAFDVKQVELLRSAEDHFILRKPSFFKKHSGVKKAEGFDMDKMNSQVGIMPKGSLAAENLETQEKGGIIKNRSSIYMDTARTSQNKSKTVRRANYLQNQGLVGGAQNKRRSRKSASVASAVVAKRTNKLWLYVTGVEGTYLKVRSISFSGTGMNRKVKLRLIPIASYQRNRSVNVKPRPFLEDASEAELNKVYDIFITNAARRMRKRLES